MTGKELIKTLERDGWTLDHVTGSHHIMVKKGRRSIPVPVHGARDIPRGLVHRILKQAEIQRQGA